jgi:1-acyl-sn-glycerol-3-phosphate acyltransferase
LKPFLAGCRRAVHLYSAVSDSSAGPRDAGEPGYPRRGTPFTRALAHRVLGLAGWRVQGGLPACPRFILIVAPHTSNWDFVIGVLAMFATGLRASWLGKHTLFRLPLAPLFRWLGGEPIDRASAQGTVGTAIEHFRTRRQWVLALTPEGTRRPVTQWKTGFHRIAVGAGVPIVPVSFDYRSRVVGIGAPVQPGPDESASVARLGSLFHKEMARHPAQYVEQGVDRQPGVPQGGRP